MSVSVNTSLYILGRNIWSGAAPPSLTVRITVGPKRLVSRLALRMLYLRFTSNSEKETVVSHVTPSNFWLRSIMALKERQVVDCKYVIVYREKDTYLQIIIKNRHPENNT